MKKIIFYIAFLVLLSVSACQKCQECKQYCAYCVPHGNSGLVVKICASKDVTHYQVDSMMNSLNATGYQCSLSDKYKKVCDSESKLTDAVNYYLLEDYYCYPK